MDLKFTPDHPAYFRALENSVASDAFAPNVMKALISSLAKMPAISSVISLDVPGSASSIMFRLLGSEILATSVVDHSKGGVYLHFYFGRLKAFGDLAKESRLLGVVYVEPFGLIYLNGPVTVGTPVGDISAAASWNNVIGCVGQNLWGQIKDPRESLF